MSLRDHDDCAKLVAESPSPLRPTNGMRISSRALGIYAMNRDYEGAISLLNSRRRQRRPVDPIPRVGRPDVHPTPNTGKPSIRGMKEWLQVLGHGDADLNVIHIAGTKGKGSTCMFTESFLRVHRERTGFPSKIGLYTSPHITYVWERIRINSQPLSEERFTTYFFEVWDTLYHSPQITKDEKRMPRYLQFLALLSYHVFIREGVDVAIIETHSGGEYDATNVSQNTVVAGIATLGLDHIAALGPTIVDIAWHKGGIIKPGSLAYSAPQEPAAAAVLQRRADEKQIPLEFVSIDSEIPSSARALKPEVQRTNCALALAIARGYLAAKALDGDGELTTQDIIRGIDQYSWRGRFEHIVEGNNQWFIDGAHNAMSVRIAASWFADIASDTQSTSALSTRIMIFSHISERDGVELLRNIAQTLHEAGIKLQHVIFSTYQEKADGTIRVDAEPTAEKSPSTMALQADYAIIWKSLYPGTETYLEPTIEDALSRAREIGSREHAHGMQTFITGSLHLVGGVVSLLQPLKAQE